MKYICYECKKEFNNIKKCQECGVYLCNDCYNDGICEECECEEEMMYF